MENRISDLELEPDSSQQQFVEPNDYLTDITRNESSRYQPQNIQNQATIERQLSQSGVTRKDRESMNSSHLSNKAPEQNEILGTDYDNEDNSFYEKSGQVALSPAKEKDLVPSIECVQLLTPTASQQDNFLLKIS